MIALHASLMYRDEGVNLSVGVQRIYKRFSKFAYVDVRVGKCLLTSCERVIQKKTLNPFGIDTIWLDALLQQITVSCKTLIQVNSMKT